MTTLQANTDHKKIIEYYEEAGLDYGAWSAKFNMHFGYWKWGMHPFKLEPMLDQMNQEVLDRLGLQKTTLPMVLDAGCGLGTSSRYMANRRPDAFFYDVTVTPWQIKKAKRMNAEAGLTSQISLLKADYQDLPMAAESFDAAFAIESACYAEGAGKKRFLREMYRVLRPGARLVVTDGFLRSRKPLAWPFNWIYRRCTSAWALNQFADIQSFTKEMRAAGFKNIQVEDIGWNIAPSVAHIPKTTIKFYRSLLRKGESWHLSRQRWNNVIAPILGLLLGLARPLFTYCIVTAER